MTESSSESEQVTEIDHKLLIDLLPHRFPFLLVDRITNVVPFQSAVGIRAVSSSEPWFQGHFPGTPVLPGVLIVESMAQTSGALVIHSLKKQNRNVLVYFMSLDNTRFRKLVIPGDVMYVPVRIVQNRGNVWKVKCEAMVEQTKVAEADITAMIIEP